MDEPTNKAADSAASGEATFETSPPPSGEEAAPQDFPVPRIGEDGKPIYDQEFFLALSRRSKEVWNRWRAENPYVKGEPYISVTFEGVGFCEPANAVFDVSGFDFGDGANFRACKFGDVPSLRRRGANFRGAPFGAQVDFSGATFGGLADFSGATFGGLADFSGATFGSLADFSGATFGAYTNLLRATFGRVANLRGATFGALANFSGATFGFKANLRGATFGHWTDFSGATFGAQADFSSATFRGSVNFNAWSEEEWRQWRSSFLQDHRARSWPDDRKQQFLHIPEYLEEAKPDTFQVLKFERVQFEGEADFSGRELIGRLDFTRARFNEPPIFDGCERTQNLDFYGARIGFAGKLPRFWNRQSRKPAVSTRSWTALSDTVLRLRELRTLAEDTKNHDLERDLYIEERKAERGILFAQYWREGEKQRRVLAHCLWIAVMGVYWALADYGRSFMRPLVALGLSAFFFHWAYSAVLIAPSDTSRADDFRNAVWAFSISNTVPFVGAFTLERDVKLTLLCGDRPISAQAAPSTPTAQNAQPSTLSCTLVPGLRFQLLVLLQSIFSALCVFFIALALRNYFKLR